MKFNRNPCKILNEGTGSRQTIAVFEKTKKPSMIVGDFILKETVQGF